MRFAPLDLHVGLSVSALAHISETFRVRASPPVKTAPGEIRRVEDPTPADYARLPSIRHYLIVDPKSGVVVHHRIDGDAAIRTAIVRSGALALDPPGIKITIEAIFPSLA